MGDEVEHSSPVLDEVVCETVAIENTVVESEEVATEEPPPCDSFKENTRPKKRKAEESPINSEASPEKNDLSSESSISMPPIETLGKGKRARIPNKRYSDILLSPSPRSSKNSVENGEKIESETDEEMTALPGAVSPTAKKPKVASDNVDPKYKKPFTLGWKRELVFRATCENPNKPMGDIYYYTPDGKKLRSMREIGENLKGKDLSLENFTFLKEPLGLNDPDKEIIRDAKLVTKRATTKSGSRTPKVLSPKLSSPKAGSSSGDTVSTASPKGRTKGNIKVKLPPVKKTDKRPLNDDIENDTPVKRANKKSVKQIPNVEMESKQCSIRCEGVLVMVPTLQCRLCLCLYHYECVGLSPHVQIQEYVCKNCRQEHGQSVASTASIVLPPLAPIDTIAPQSSLPIESSQLEAVTPIGDVPTNLPNLLPLPKVAKDAPQSSMKETKSLVGSVTSWLPHSSTIQVDDTNVRPTRPQYVEYLAGRKFLIIPKHNVVSVSPTSLPTKRFSFPVPNNNNENKNETVEAPMESNEDGQELSEPVESPRPKRRVKSTIINSEDKPKETSKGMDCYIQNLSYGYNTLLNVFQYLKVQDLLRAGCVCTMWRDMASHPSLWRTVRMKNSQVHSVEGLANTLHKHGTVHLDLRKMLLPNNGGDDIWPEFSKSIERVQTLRKIELCRCPAAVVEKLAVTNKKLEVVNAVTIRCESMSLDMLSCLKNLKELRLKSTSGLSLTSDITSLKELTNLTHLSLTSIKELHKMDLKVIAALTRLESLDLGECNDFPANFGEDILVKLEKLEKLRLEKGQNNCHTFEILDAVKKMTQLDQLELVNFDIKSGFDVALGGCSNIRKLLIIPTYISQSATTNHMVLGGVLRLQSTLSHFVWGVTLELLRVTELFVDQCEDTGKKEKKEKKPTGNGDSIPVLKPIPLINGKNDPIAPAHDPPQVEILPLPNLQKLLLHSLPTTRVKILKIPFHATWRQSITDTVN